MAHGPEITAKVRAAYVYDRKSLDTIADQFGIGVATVRRWKAKAETDGDDWERARSAARMAGDGTQLIAQMILDDYLQLHQATVESVKSAAELPPLTKAMTLSRLADAFTKTMAILAVAQGLADLEFLDAVGRAQPEGHHHAGQFAFHVLVGVGRHGVAAQFVQQGRQLLAEFG